MSKAEVRTANRRRRAAFGVVRRLLKEYGCYDIPSVKQSMIRLILEHKGAVVRAAESDYKAKVALEEAALARKTRDGAQALATKRHAEAQALRNENAVLREELDAMRKRLSAARIDRYEEGESPFELGALER